MTHALGLGRGRPRHAGLVALSGFIPVGRGLGARPRARAAARRDRPRHVRPDHRGRVRPAGARHARAAGADVTYRESPHAARDRPALRGRAGAVDPCRRLRAPAPARALTISATARDDDPARDEHAQRRSPRRARSSRAHGDDRVHVRVGGDERGARVAQQPDVGAEREQRAEEDEVDEAAERAARRSSASWTSPSSPATSAGDDAAPTPPASICMPGADERRHRAASGPARAASRRPSRRRRRRARAPPAGSIAPGARGLTSTATPAKPTATPERRRARSGARRRTSRSSTTTQSGIEAITSAATPDGTVCCAHETPPLPTASSSVPVRSAAAPLARVRAGRRSRRQRRATA